VKPDHSLSVRAPGGIRRRHLASQPHRRFIKTHTPLDGLPFDHRVTYVCVGRDPRDAGFSWSNHLANMDLNAFAVGGQPSAGSNLVLLHYDDLQADLEGQMRQPGRRLRIDVPEPRWPQLVAAARFGEMRRRADQLVPNRG
jgi:hypothetical protein